MHPTFLHVPSTCATAPTLEDQIRSDHLERHLTTSSTCHPHCMPSSGKRLAAGFYASATDPRDGASEPQTAGATYDNPGMDPGGRTLYACRMLHMFTIRCRCFASCCECTPLFMCVLMLLFSLLSFRWEFALVCSCGEASPQYWLARWF